MKNRRLKQTALSLWVVLSLFASSVAASCACPHHQEKSEANASSCHEQSAETHSDEMPMPPETSAADNFSANDKCVCLKTAPRIFDKSQSVKIEKQAATIALTCSVPVKLSAPVAVAETIDFVKPFYLSDSFYNLKSPRAPPVS